MYKIFNFNVGGNKFNVKVKSKNVSNIKVIKVKTLNDFNEISTKKTMFVVDFNNKENLNTLEI